jgi:segregation and condensation protein B
MSLKAKLEAVIYAAEEPVTLAQLSALFVADALEWKAEQEAASAEEAAEAAQPLLNGNDEFVYLEQNPAENAPTETAEKPATEANAEAVEEATPETTAEPSAEATEERPAESAPAAESTAAPDSASVDSEAEEKRLARQRDREARVIIRQLLDELIATYASDARGVEIREIAGGYRMATKPECHDAVRLFVKSLKPALKLSLPALETLAVIAYKQPVTAPEVNEIRGVDSSGVFGSLLARKLIATAGRKQVIGRPILYKTTREFLLRFGLKDVSELPSMEEFEKMADLELEEPETAGGEESALQQNSAAGSEFDEAASEEQEAIPAQNEEPLAETATSEAPTAEPSAIAADSTPAEAAPDAPSPTEQAETETPHYDEEEN